MAYVSTVLMLVLFVASVWTAIKERMLLSTVLQSAMCLTGAGFVVVENDWHWTAWTLLGLAVLSWVIYWGTRDNEAETE